MARVARGRKGIAIGCAALVLLGVLGCMGWGALRRARVERFREACAGSHGLAYPSAEARLRSATTVITTVQESPHNPMGVVSFRVRASLSSFATCNVRLADDHVVSQTFTTGHDLDHCTDRRAYPRRWWLCAIGAAVLP